MRPSLETLIDPKYLREQVRLGRTLQSIVDEVYKNTGWRFSSPALSKLCAKLGIPCQRSGPRSGELHTGWKGGVIQDKSGYRLVYAPDHPHRRKHTPYVLEHRLVLEKSLGRRLLKTEVVHHKNGDKTDNRLENLELFASNAEHLRETLAGKVPNWTEAGILNIRQGQKNKKYHWTESEIQSRQSRLRLYQTIRKELKLDVLPNRKTVLRYLDGLGISYQQALCMAATHEQLRDALIQNPKHKHETAR